MILSNILPNPDKKGKFDVYADGYEQYKGSVFIMTALERKTTNGSKEVGITRADTPSTELIWYPIDGLTIIKLPERM
jgi:hypothetical protein